ncbi:hypothetical protein V6N11_077385 [Hibiscus sabdariffa]|uniref:Uncharacterized protein n=1 Tax=Hibiscus sabdariffa TaxID=183260 RepID=A0ABR2TD26_9ROSI
MKTNRLEKPLDLKDYQAITAPQKRCFAMSLPYYHQLNSHDASRRFSKSTDETQKTAKLRPTAKLSRILMG